MKKQIALRFSPKMLLLAVLFFCFGKMSAAEDFNPAPVLLSHSQPSGSTTGGYLDTLHGHFFGDTAANVSVLFHGDTLPTFNLLNDSTIVFTVPPGTGLDRTVKVVVSGQNSNTLLFDYFAPTISNASPDHGPAVGGTWVGLKGSNFGNDPAKVSVSFANSPVPFFSLISHDSLIFPTPPGVGSLKTVTVTVDAQPSNSKFFSYDAPVLNSLSATTGSTKGNFQDTLYGRNFGTNASFVVLRFGGNNVPNFQLLNDSTIVFTVPPGTGTGKTVRVLVALSGSNTLTFNYLPPDLTAITPNHAPTTGNVLVKLSGSDFGTSASGVTVSVGGTPVGALFSVSHDSIFFFLPAGAGAARPVLVSVAGQTSDTLHFNYDRPVLFGFNPGSGPTAGGTQITVTGINFGPPGTTVQAFVGNQPATNVLLNSQTSMSFQLPPGQGTGQVFSLVAGGQTSVNNLIFNYLPPVLDSISPNSGPAAGGNLITFMGSNFGTNADSVRVLFDTLSLPVATGAAGLLTHTTSKFVLPPGVGQGHSVRVKVGTRTSASKTFNYLPPQVQSIAPLPATPGETVWVTGSGFGPAETFATVSIGNWDASTTTVHSDDSLSFVVPTGYGSNLPLRVQVGGQNSQPKPFTFAPPVISSISPDSVSWLGGETVSVFGSFLGINAADFTLKLGNEVMADAVLVSSTELRFTAPSRSIASDSVRVALGNGPFSAPQALYFLGPQLDSMSPEHGTIVGGTLVTLQGQRFAPGVSVEFSQLGYGAMQSLTPTTITFLTPEGLLQDVQVRVVAGDLASAPRFFDYNLPVLDSITPNHGPTEGGGIITLHGKDLYLPYVQPQVYINGILTVLAPGSVAPHTIKAYVLPGVGAGVEVRSGRYSLPELSNPQPFNYDPPVIFGTTENPGAFLTLNGINFGFRTDSVSIFFDGAPVAFSPGTLTHNAVQIFLPEGVGTGHTLQLKAGSQWSNTYLYDFPPPDLQSLSHPITSPGAWLEINGEHFGPLGTPVTVTIGGLPAMQNIVYNDGLIWLLAPIGGAGLHQPVVVTVGGQTSDTLYIDFEPPVLSNTTPTIVNWQGGETVLLFGQHFGEDPAGIELTVGGVPTAVLEVLGPSVLTFVMPQVPTLSPSVVIERGGQPSNAIYLQCLGPVLDNISPGIGTIVGGTTVELTGQRLVPGMNVSFGSWGFGTDVQFVSATKITCKTPPGMGEDVPVVLQGPGSVLSNAKTFDYKAPSLITVSPAGGPTVGGTEVLCFGQDLFLAGHPVSATVGGLPATVVPAESAAPYVLKILTPPGAGLDQEVKIVRAGQISNAKPFDYDAPVVENVSPANLHPGKTAIVSGFNFGYQPASVSVTVGGLAATNVVWVSQTEIAFKTPINGTGGNNPVRVTVAGQTSVLNPNVKIGYVPSLLSTVMPGAWNSPTTWDCACIPFPGDTLFMYHEVVSTTALTNSGLILLSAKLTAPSLQNTGRLAGNGILQIGQLSGSGILEPLPTMTLNGNFSGNFLIINVPGGFGAPVSKLIVNGNVNLTNTALDVNEVICTPDGIYEFLTFTGTQTGNFAWTSLPPNFFTSLYSTGYRLQVDKTEICQNNNDDDCDGLTDEWDSTFYPDLDGDGYGFPTDSACSNPGGWAINSNDCNDADPLEHPYSVWFADLDNDGYTPDVFNTALHQCSRPAGYKLVSELLGMPNAPLDCDDSDPIEHPGQIWFADLDNDGYSPGTTLTQCSRPTGYKLLGELASVGVDCNDNDPLRRPGQIWYKDADSDGFPSGTTASVTACNPPANTGWKTVSQLIGTTADCRDNNANVFPGATEICNNLDDDCDNAIDEGLKVALTAAATAATCHGGSNGSINLTVNGTPPYNFQWSNGATTEDLSNLPAATYTVTVTKTGGCSATISRAVSQPAALDFTTALLQTSTSPTLFRITVTATGGSSPGSYDYRWRLMPSGTWSAWTTNRIFSNRPPGTYEIGVRTRETTNCGLAIVKTVLVGVAPMIGPGGGSSTSGATLQAGERELASPEVGAGDIIVFPNPTSGDFNVQTDRPISGEGLLQLFDLQGKMMLTTALAAGTSHWKIRVGNELPPGIYCLRADLDGRYFQARIVFE